jgi:hypothetical protein
MSSLMVHCITAYQAKRAFMAMKTPAITRMMAVAIRLVCLASETAAN